MALTSTGLPETSELEKYEVELYRLQFALKASLRQKRYLDAAKLALKAGGVTAGDDLNRTIIQANTDLAAQFIESDRIQELVSRRTFGSGWMGSHHAYDASLLSGRAALAGDSLSRLRMAYEWLDSWSRLTEERRKEERVEYADIAELSMAELNLRGAGAAAASIGRWKPREVSFRVGRMVAARLVDHGRVADLNDLAVATGNDIQLVIAIILELRRIHQVPPPAVVERAFRCVLHSGDELMEDDVRDIEEIGVAAVTALVEAALQVCVCSHSDASALLARHLPVSPPRGLSSSYSGSRSPMLRAYCLQAALEGQALQVDDLAHAELRSELEDGSQHQWSQETREFKRYIGALLPWYKLWAETFLDKITHDGLTDRLARARDVTTSITQYREESHLSNEVVLIWFDVLVRMNEVNVESMEVLKSWIKSLRAPLYTRTLTALARKGAWQDETRAVALELAGQAFALTRDERTDAETKSAGYVDVARSVLAISPDEARAYFNEAVTVAGGISEENLWRWDAMLDLAERAARRDRPVPETTYQFARCAELTWDYVVRDKHFDWWSTVVALSSLCPSSCLAILSRWRDRGFGWPGRILPIAVHVLVERGCVDPRDAMALIGFEAEWDYAKLLSGVLEACTNRGEKEAATSYLLRYVQVADNPSSVWLGLKELTARHGLSVPRLDEHLAFAARRERATEERSAEHRNGWSAGKLSPRPWDDIFSGNDLTTANGIARSYASSRRHRLRGIIMGSSSRRYAEYRPAVKLRSLRA